MRYVIQHEYLIPEQYWNLSRGKYGTFSHCTVYTEVEKRIVTEANSLPDNGKFLALMHTNTNHKDQPS